MKRTLSRSVIAVAGILAAAVLLDAAPASQPVSRIAFGSCSEQNKRQPVWDAVNRLRPELFLFLGDNIYADTEDMDKMRQDYAKFSRIPGYINLRKTARILAIWDDHDYGVNDGGEEYPKKEESKQIFLDFFGVPKDSPRRARPGVFDAEVIGPPGKRVQFILLDTRYNRSPLKKNPIFMRAEGPYGPNTDPQATILGAEQWEFLREQLDVPAEVRFLCSSIQVIAEDHGFEKWGNFPAERKRLFDLLVEKKVTGLVILSGDRHLAELSSMDIGLGYPLYDLTSSGLNKASYNIIPMEHNDHRVGTVSRVNNFGYIAIDWLRKDPRINLQIRDEEGDIRFQQKVDLSELAPAKSGSVPE